MLPQPRPTPLTRSGRTTVPGRERPEPRPARPLSRRPGPSFRQALRPSGQGQGRASSRRARPGRQRGRPGAGPAEPGRARTGASRGQRRSTAAAQRGGCEPAALRGPHGPGRARPAAAPARPVEARRCPGRRCLPCMLLLLLLAAPGPGPLPLPPEPPLGLGVAIVRGAGAAAAALRRALPGRAGHTAPPPVRPRLGPRNPSPPGPRNPSPPGPRACGTAAAGRGRRCLPRGDGASRGGRAAQRRSAAAPSGRGASPAARQGTRHPARPRRPLSRRRMDIWCHVSHPCGRRGPSGASCRPKQLYGISHLHSRVRASPTQAAPCKLLLTAPGPRGTTPCRAFLDTQGISPFLPPSASPSFSFFSCPLLFMPAHGF